MFNQFSTNIYSEAIATIAQNCDALQLKGDLVNLTNTVLTFVHGFCQPEFTLSHLNEEQKEIFINAYTSIA